MDDVSINSNNDDYKWNPSCSQSLASVVCNVAAKSQQSDKINCDDKKCNVSKLLQHCDKTSTKTKNLLIMKKDLQCERCGYIQAICDGTNIDKPWSKSTICRLNDEHLFNNFNNVTLKSTNYRLKSGSSISLGKISTTSLDNINLTIRRRIVYTQVLLEAFGNASNQLNSNSSRFVSLNINFYQFV